MDMSIVGSVMHVSSSRLSSNLYGTCGLLDLSCMFRHQVRTRPGRSPEGCPGRKDRPVRSLEGCPGQKDRPVRSPEGYPGQKDRPVRSPEGRLGRKDRPERSPEGRPGWKDRPVRTPGLRHGLNCRPRQNESPARSSEKFHKSRSRNGNLFLDI